jgi:hypothetical protein
MNANTNSANACSKKFCKVCFDAGKPETVYTNHTVKTMNVRTGKMETTCVTLLALECRYCFKAGHTVKFCPVLKESNKGRKEHEIHHARERHGTTANASATALEKAVIKKGFALLQEDSDDDEVAVASVAFASVAFASVAVACDEFPALPFNMTAPKVSSVMTFAATAALPPKPKVTFAAVPAPAPAPAPIKEQDLDEDSDYEVNDDDDEPQMPAVSYSDSCFSYRERHGYAEDDSW